VRNLWTILSVFLLWTCSSGGGESKSPTEPEGPTYVVDLAILQGQAQKGPFNNGTAMNIAELTNTLSPTGRNFSSAISDNTGRFSVANVQLESPYVELRANGFYYNEVSGNASDAQLTLFALSDLTNKSSVNVNIISHLEKNRIINLMSGDNPKTFVQAKVQALTEVLTIFDFDATGVSSSELLDITQTGDGNAKLLAISAILQGNQSVAEMSELLANISTDIASDGILDNEGLKQKLKENTSSLNVSDIRTNLEARLTQLGINGTIPDFESQVEHFLKRPSADDISTVTDQNQALDITLTGTDPENEALTFQIVQNPGGGSVSLNESTATYTPTPTYTGTDYFFYVANDGSSNSDQARVEIVVNDINLAPTAIDSSYTIYADTEIDITLEGVDIDGDNLNYSIVTGPTNGSYEQYNINHIIYTPNEGYSGSDSFTFVVNDGEYDSSEGTINITIKASNTWGTNNNAEQFNAILKTTDNNLIVAGNYYNAEEGYSRSLLLKYNNLGEILWQKEYSEVNSFTKISHTSDGGFLLVQLSNKIFKVDADGNLLWELSPTKQVNDAIELSDGNFAITGWYNSDIHITKIDQSGTIIWEKIFGSNESERAYDIIEMSNGDIVFGGSTRGFGAVDEDFYVIRLSSSGETIFQRIWGTQGSDEVYDMLEESNTGNLVVTGHYSNGFSIYLAKLDNVGTVLSENASYSLKSNGHKEIKETLDGGFIIVGSEDTTNPYMQYDIIIVKTDSNGNQEWSKLFGLGNSPDQNDYAYDVAVLDDGSYAVVGATTSYGNVISDEGNYVRNAILLLLDADGNDRQSWE
jgi:hypothetical protein